MRACSLVLFGSILATLAGFGEYQYIVDQPVRTPRCSVACSAAGPLNAAGHVSVCTAATAFTAKTRTSAASAACDLVSTPYTGAVLLIR